MFGERGLVHIYTGDGKGKTTSALGLAMRALGHGARVIMVQFMKGWDSYGELKTALKLEGLEIIQAGPTTFTKAANCLRIMKRLKGAWKKRGRSLTKAAATCSYSMR